MNDEQFMRQALELAERGRYSTSPNPMVGCVIVRDGNILAEGWHRRAGEGHAEVEALREMERRLQPARTPAEAGGPLTMYVTLEPCAHHGRTPPCVDAVIASGVRRAVIGMRDPHDVVDGRGIEKLRAAGIDVTTGVCEADARRLNEKFIWAVSRNLPFVLIKAAITLDGKLATVSGDSQWITGEEARERSLELREEYDAILVGSGTVRADNPRLTRRLGLNQSITPWTRIVLDGDGDMPPHAQILGDGVRTIVFSSADVESRPDVDFVRIEGRADLGSVLAEVYARGIQSVIVEGGALVISEFLRAGLWQKMILFVAPTLIGGREAPSILSGDGVLRLTDAYRFRFDRVEMVGRDLMITAYPT
ncbi:MAG TPA: bifunctional diaminohydroxyphosphoribosylaminopyrimidine deaminase/5-amino-6-(5-phosphoribosylamino)uracil reductase RibD [Thermoanaerobaculia bacterium]|nr:bifunctional diaminohydroxyphosphoribosylaminopyrimidine deaminase/5-amino-6-(5-phosphoribosylamino)uracil reductase RibD [Thermoanaerobaculia bacterium]